MVPVHFLWGGTGAKNTDMCFHALERRCGEYLREQTMTKCISRPANTVLMSHLLVPKYLHLDRLEDNLHQQYQRKKNKLWQIECFLHNFVFTHSFYSIYLLKKRRTLEHCFFLLPSFSPKVFWISETMMLILSACAWFIYDWCYVSLRLCFPGIMLSF